MTCGHLAMSECTYSDRIAVCLAGMARLFIWLRVLLRKSMSYSCSQVLIFCKTSGAPMDEFRPGNVYWDVAVFGSCRHRVMGMFVVRKIVY
jgi:hypothetical protein